MLLRLFVSSMWKYPQIVTIFVKLTFIIHYVKGQLTHGIGGFMVLIGWPMVLHEVEGYKKIYEELYSTTIAGVSHISCVSQRSMNDQI